MTTKQPSEAERRQALLAEILDDPELHADLREHPDRFAADRRLPREFIDRLAAISPERAAAFARSRQVKQSAREGRAPSRIDG